MSISKPVIVYRVEDQWGQCPWDTGLIDRHNEAWSKDLRSGAQQFDPQILWMHLAEAIAKDHPRYPVHQATVDPNVKYGARDLRTLALWFPSREGCAAMEREGGVRLALYGVEEAQVRDITYGYQVTYDGRAATLKSVWPIAALHTHNTTEKET